MADEKQNQDKPEYLNESEEGAMMGEDFNSQAVDNYPVGTAIPLQSNIDYDQINGMVTADRATANNEEMAAEIAAPAPVGMMRRDSETENAGENGQAEGASGGVMGLSAIAVSILSLFVLPIILGITGVVLGFIARSRGSKGLGSWAIGLGALSIIIGMFILPFF